MKRILVTGAPGTGKTTLIKRLCEDIAPYHPVGFYTKEIREGGVRRGFELIGLHGENGVLAHVDTPSDSRVGKYGVDVRGFDEFLRSIPFGAHTAGPVVIDEIGKMECFSRRFMVVVDELIRADRVLVATIARRGGGFISKVKASPGTRLYEITRGNRDAVYAEVRDAVLKVLRG